MAVAGEGVWTGVTMVMTAVVEVAGEGVGRRQLGGVGSLRPYPAEAGVGGTCRQQSWRARPWLSLKEEPKDGRRKRQLGHWMAPSMARKSGFGQRETLGCPLDGPFKMSQQLPTNKNSV